MATNNKQILSDLLEQVVALRKEISELKITKTSTGSGASKAPRKPRDPDAPPKAPNAWIVFTGKVRTVLKQAGKPAGKEAQQYASHLKTTFPEAYEMDDEAILAEFDSWTPPPPKPKPTEDKAEAEAKPKPKRTLSDDQKAKMAAGRAAAKERKLAEAAAKEASGDEAEVPSPKAAAPPKAPSALAAFPFKGKKCLRDAETNGIWQREADGSKGAWLGVLSADKKSIDASAPNPDA